MENSSVSRKPAPVLMLNEKPEIAKNEKIIFMLVFSAIYSQ
jgi:hypothetical protein